MSARPGICWTRFSPGPLPNRPGPRTYPGSLKGATLPSQVKGEGIPVKPLPQRGVKTPGCDVLAKLPGLRKPNAGDAPPPGEGQAKKITLHKGVGSVFGSRKPPPPIRGTRTPRAIGAASAEAGRRSFPQF